MVCHAGNQLGASNFCTDTCDPASDVAADGQVCLSSGAELSFCQPSEPPGGATCPNADLACLRTDVFTDQGVCLAMSVCASDHDCTDVVRTTCLSTLLLGLYGPGAGMKTDHLHCLQAGCFARHSDCQPGEVCLPTVIPVSSSPPDICVPQCDGRLNCPPNYLCYQKVSGPMSPNVCIPAILGFACTSDLDCLMGTCVIGEGFASCSLPCETNADCLPISHGRGPFVCNDVGVAGQKYCMNPVSFSGANCALDSQCGTDEACTNYQPLLNPGAVQPGECRHVCTTSADCPRRGGFAYSCVKGTCFPGRLGVPCEGDRDCIPDLSCLPLPLAAPTDDGAGDAGAPATASTVCTFTCTTDADCKSAAHILTEGDYNYCGGGVCQVVRQSGVVCTKDSECASKICMGGSADAGQTGYCQ